MELRKLKLLVAIVVTCIATGCSPENKPVPLPAGATLEVYAIATTKTASTKQGTDPRTGAPLILQNPPIIATADVATVTKAVRPVEMADGSPSQSNSLALAVK